MILTFCFPTWAGGREKNLQEKVQAKQRRLSRDKKHRAARYLEYSAQSSEDEESGRSYLKDQVREDVEDSSDFSPTLDRQSGFQPARVLVSSGEPETLPLSQAEDLDDAISYSPSPNPEVSIHEIIAEWKADGRSLFNDRNTVYRCLDVLRAIQNLIRESGEVTFASEIVQGVLGCIAQLDRFDREYIQLLRTYHNDLVPHLDILMMTQSAAVDIYDILSGLWQTVSSMRVFTQEIKASREGLSRGWWLASASEEDSSEQGQSDSSGYFESKSASNSSSRSGSCSESSY